MAVEDGGGNQKTTVTQIEGRGRAVVASKPLTAGEIILKDSPILLYSALPLNPHSTSTRHHQIQNLYCSHCFKILSNPLSVLPCPLCSSTTAFCGPTCRSTALISSHTPWVCQTLTRLRDCKFPSLHTEELQIQARFLVAAYNLSRVSPCDFQTLLSLQGGPSEDANAVFLHSLISSLCNGESISFTLELTAALLAKDKLNAFGLMEPFGDKGERSVRAYGIYPNASFFNHDCLPNACRFDYVDSNNSADGSNLDVVVRAIHDVPQGREICLSYFPVNLKYSERQRRLKEDYGFTCTCDRCNVEANWSDNEEEEEEQDEDAHVSNDRPLLGEKRSGKDFRRAFKGTSSGSGSEQITKRPRLDTIVLKTPKSQMAASSKQVKMGSSKKSRKEVISSICKFFYHAGIPSHAANSPYFHKMLELVGQYGHDLVGPSCRMISGRFLQDEIVTIRNYLVEYKASWAVTGCSILADSWKDTQGKTLINFLVSCPRGIYFVSSVDATELVEDSTSLFELLDKVVEEMGEENVVQVITENTHSYQAAGKMLEEKRKNLFWTPCAAYCIDRILEDILRVKLVGECMEKGQKITKLIYNQIGLLHLMKKEFTGGQELLRPCVTQYASSFATLQSLLDHKIGLKRMFQSNKWLSSQFSKSDEGKEVEKIVQNSAFWKKMQYVRKSVDPIMQVLQKINSDESLSMPHIYNDMYRAKLAIKSNHDDDVRKYGHFWSVIDNRWNSLFHHPLYLAAYFLNPSYRYRPDFVAHPDVVRGLNSCLVRLEPDNGRRISASMQISEFGSAKADFGTELAISTRSELNPAAWWQQHGINCLELQRIAVRILSQTCSSFGCEHSWSIYDHIHRQRRNHLAQKRLNDLSYVHYNLRLRERQIRRRSNDPVSLDSVLQESLLYDWIVDAERPALPEDEEILYHEVEQADTCENDLIEYEDESRKGSLEMVTLAEVEPLNINPPSNAGTATDDDDDDDDDNADLNFLDDDLSE